MLLHIKITPDTYVIKCNVGGNKSSGYEVTANERKKKHLLLPFQSASFFVVNNIRFWFWSVNG